MLRRFGILALAALFAVGAPSRSDAQAPALRVGLPSIPTVLDPATALEGPDISLSGRQILLGTLAP